MKKQFRDRYGNTGIVPRTPANDGLWLSVLLTVCYAMNIWTLDEVQISSSYRHSAIVCFGLFLHSVYTFVTHRSTQKSICTALNIGLISFLLDICLGDNIYLSIACGFSTIILYNYVYFCVLREMPQCFTLGEAAIVCQGFVIFLYQAFLNVPRIFIDERITSETRLINIVLQIILLATCLIITLCRFRIFRGTVMFWATTSTIIIGTIIFPIYEQILFVVLLEFIFNDLKRIAAIAFYMILLLVTGLFATWQANRSATVNTTTRKIFHILILMVYLHGLLYQCTLLYVASTLMLVLLLILETARAIKLQPIYKLLERVVICFIDEKDTGSVALTPVYLLVGCSLPMWLHPVVCDLTDSAGHNLIKLMAGVLSVGIGDTAASVCGYNFGKHKWPGSVKSVEGTLASIAAQAGMVFILFKMSFIHLSTVRAANTGVAIIVNALVEAKTNQIDNLVLPLVTYIILCAI
ncbi:dolichol kinase [Toxorhynchites rutilus septentrionalis]|uniref:dolichol kinase n=1 Tax=Toxorhynchites rutilus septentrionalis TaxID=329112 RepID=UPI002479A72F|nr:dolichol kinase [Toxorhynchites rutilus septentrionalis]